MCGKEWSLLCQQLAEAAQPNTVTIAIVLAIASQQGQRENDSTPSYAFLAESFA